MSPGAAEAGPLRLNRFLAIAGVAARRKADVLIAEGRVTVNGQPSPPGGQLVTAGVDVVEVDGRPVVIGERPRRYFAVNKPPGYLSAVSDRGTRPVVTRLVPVSERPGLAPVGRLDLDSRGLILLTDDGELSFRLQHPRHHVEKEYDVRVDRELTEAQLERLRAGVRLSEGQASPAIYEVGAEDACRIRVVLRQGWKRQLRRSFQVVGRRVVDLRRVRVGPLLLGDLAEGATRPLTELEVAALKSAVGLAQRHPVVAIDGPSASGKSTLGRLLARALGVPLVDTGLMYRAITVLAADSGIAPDDVTGLAALARGVDLALNTSTAERPRWLVRAGDLDLTGRVHDAAIAPVLTRVSQVAEVRRELVARQRAYAATGVVMVGRDIGTVVFPEADLKLFITASEAERMRRRARQMGGRHDELMGGEISDRDAADTGRAVAPLRPAEDAHTIDTDGRGIAEVFEEILSLVPDGLRS